MDLPLQLPRCGINFLDLTVPAVSMLVNSDECILAAECTQVAGVQELAADADGDSFSRKDCLRYGHHHHSIYPPFEMGLNGYGSERCEVSQVNSQLSSSRTITLHNLVLDLWRLGVYIGRL